MIFYPHEPFVEDKYTGFTVGTFKILGKLRGKTYIVSCSECAKDEELFKGALFTTLINDFKGGQIPCGCSRSCRWVEWQQIIRVNREAQRRGFEFLGWVGDFSKKSTYCRLSCKVHGVWETTKLSNFMNGCGCPSCWREVVGKSNRIEESVMIDKFLSTESYHPETKFSRSKRLNGKGYEDYWTVYCPCCDTTNESLTYGLSAGKVPCECSYHNQKTAYVHLIKDYELPIALKFGVTANPRKRLNTQRRATVFEIEPLSVWDFPDSKSCKSAEKALMQSLPTSLLNKQEFEDGWTETTSLLHLDTIHETFAKFGGVLRNSKAETSLVDSILSGLGSAAGNIF